jgi:putative glycosyltransferase
MKLSVVATLYESEDHINEFHQRINKISRKIFKNDFEIILVNDGSTDQTLAIAKKILSRNKNITLVDFSKNFGHHNAMMHGLNYAKGDYVFLIDSDLEEQPEWLELFYKEIKKLDIDVVYGVQKYRKGKFFEKISGIFFWKILNFFSDTKIPVNMVTSRLMKKKYVQALLKYSEYNPMIAGLWYIVGFNQKSIAIHKESSSESTYTLSKKIMYLLAAVTSFSNKPLYLIFYFGLFISLFSTFFIIYILYLKFFREINIDGWVSTIASIWFVGGILISFIGIISLYISQIFLQTKNRPNVLIKEVYKSKK